MGAKKNNGGGGGGGGGGDNNKKGGDGAEKKEDNPITVVLKIDMHCDGCTTKIVKTLKSFDGVDSVKPETGAHKLTVVGKVDPAKLREKLAGKLKKKVDLISPQPKKEKDDNGNNKKQPEKEKKDDKKPKEPPVTTAVLKLNLHCQGCIEKIHKIVTKTKGFHDMSIDKEKELVTLKGAMDMKAVVESLKARLKRNVEIVPPKKDKDKDKDNKEKGEGGGDNGGGGKKKNKEEGGEGGNAGGGKLDKMDFPVGQPGYGQVPPYGVVYAYDYPPPPMMYIGNQLHAPQIFSDENPNACSIM